jgi:hypothetical protein
LDDQGYVHKVALNEPLSESNIISTINIHYADIFGDTGIVPNATWSLLVVRKKDVGRQGRYFLKPVADGKKDPETFLKCVYFYLDAFLVLCIYVRCLVNSSVRETTSTYPRVIYIALGADHANLPFTGGDLDSDSEDSLLNSGSDTGNNSESSILDDHISESFKSGAPSDSTTTGGGTSFTHPGGKVETESKLKSDVSFLFKPLLH